MFPNKETNSFETFTNDLSDKTDRFAIHSVTTIQKFQRYVRHFLHHPLNLRLRFLYQSHVSVRCVEEYGMFDSLTQNRLPAQVLSKRDRRSRCTDVHGGVERIQIDVVHQDARIGVKQEPYNIRLITQSRTVKSRILEKKLA